MNLAALLAIIQTLLPAVEQGVGLFVHKPHGQEKLALTFGEIEAVSAIASSVSGALAKPPAAVPSN